MFNGAFIYCFYKGYNDLYMGQYGLRVQNITFWPNTYVGNSLIYQGVSIIITTIKLPTYLKGY